MQVAAQPVSEDGHLLRNCVVGWKGADTRETLREREIHPEFLSSFANPPQDGQYYLEITCPGRQGIFRSSIYDFARGPYFHDLGRVTITK